jgi:hypothetical protein
MMTVNRRKLAFRGAISSQLADNPPLSMAVLCFLTICDNEALFARDFPGLRGGLLRHMAIGKMALTAAITTANRKAGGYPSLLTITPAIWA